jgi:RNA polymerase sigma-70 factor (ECF subfamily)
MARRPVEQLLVESEQVVEPDAAAQAEIADDVGRAREALQQLRPEQREVLELSLAAGRTHQEISAAVGIPLGTVKSHARRGLLRLRELLGVDPGAADESR